MSLLSFAKKLVDPGGFVFKGDSQKLAEKQYSTEKDIAYLNFDEQKKWNQKNYDEQVRMNDFNIAQQQAAFDYQKDLNALQMEREDTAIARRVQDLKNAGLSPTLAAGSAASATPVHAGTAPQGVAPQGVAPQLATPSDIKVRQAMFREGLAKDRMALAMTLLSNMADVSKTKAETEFIRAQKDRYVAETPIDLQIKEEIQRLGAELHDIKVDQAKKNLSLTEAKEISELWNHVASQDEHLLKTTELVREKLGVKLDEQSLRIGQNQEAITKTEALIKGVALELERFKLKTEEQMQDFMSGIGSPRALGDKPGSYPFVLMRGLVEGVDKTGRKIFKSAKSGLDKLGKLIGSDQRQ